MDNVLEAPDIRGEKAWYTQYIDVYRVHSGTRQFLFMISNISKAVNGSDENRAGMKVYYPIPSGNLT